MHLAFQTPHLILSSAVLNGGLVEADHLVNLRVPKENPQPCHTPEQTLQNFCNVNGWSGTTVGMMTSASINSFRIQQRKVQGVDIVVMLTTGLANARRIGDPAEYRKIATLPAEVGTINLAILTSAQLTEAAMVEIIMMATEAKTAALQNAQILSPVSNQIATGTGTDSTAVISGKSAPTIRYCGKHVLFGEVLGELLIDAITDSILPNKTPARKQLA